MVGLFFSGLLPGLLLVCSFFVSTVAAAPGVIEGRILNGTLPEQNAAVKEVTLYRIKENQSPEKVNSQEPQEGRYRFQELETSPQYRYRLTATYQGIPYFSDEILFGQGQAQVTLRTSDLKVYEVTENPQTIRVSRDHLILEIRDREIVATEFLLLENSSNRTVWKKNLLRFSLPEGYRDFRGPGEPIRNAGSQGGEGFWLGKPVLPGNNQVLFTYRLDFLSTQQDLTKPVDYSTDQLDLMVADKGLEIQSPNLSFQGKVDMNGQAFLRWAASNLKPGASIRLSLSKSAMTRYLYPGGVVAIVLLLAGAGFAYALVKARNTKRASLSSPAQPLEGRKNQVDALRREKKMLIAAITELDNRYEAGEMNEEDYRKARAPKFQSAVEITRKLKDQT